MSRSIIDLDELVKSAWSLEPLPVSVARLATLVTADDIDLRAVVEVVSYDQALTAALLRQANSAASGPRMEVRTVHDAVLRLGTATVLMLAMGTSVRTRMNVAVPEYDLAEGELWRHSVAAALAADAVRSVSKARIPAEASTAALLHDIGKLILARYLDPPVLAVLHLAVEQGGLSPLEAESAVLDVHHGELGGLIAQHWRLPESIVKGIQYHHNPDQCGDPIAYGVFLADSLAKRIGAGKAENMDEEMVERSLNELRIAPSVLDVIAEATAARFREVAERFLS